MGFGYDEEVTDSIISRTMTASQLIYTVREKKTTMPIIFNVPPHYITSYSTVTLAYPLGEFLIVDTLKMPEEWYDGRFYHFDKNDSSYLLRSALYQSEPTYIFRNAEVNTLEPCGGSKLQYKTGLGLVREMHCISPDDGSWDRQLVYYRKSGVVFGKLSASV